MHFLSVLTLKDSERKGKERQTMDPVSTAIRKFSQISRLWLSQRIPFQKNIFSIFFLKHQIFLS